MYFLRNYAAVDIGGTSIKYGVVDENGKVVFNAQSDTEAQKGGKHLVKKVTDIIASLIERDSSISGIGISTAGVVDTNTGCVVYANSNLPDYIGTEWKKILSERFHLPVYICNDVHAAGAAEAWIGAGRDCNNFLCVVIGTGIGGSVFINGKQFAGPHFRAAALGYMNTSGNEIVYEKKAATQALVNRITLLTGDSDVNGKNAFSRARDHNASYAEILEEWVDDLAKGIANAVLCFDPELIVIGGAISKEGQPLLQSIHDSLAKYLPEDFLAGIILKTAECGNLAGMIGAVYHIVKPQE